MNLLSLALSKQYTEDTSDALGAVKGAPCTIKSIDKTENGSLITFEWTGISGRKETATVHVKDGVDGVDGINGIDGISISKIEKIKTVGLTDTYKMTFSDGNTFEYKITNGRDGAGSEYSGDINVIESISVNGTTLTPDEDKNINIEFPTEFKTVNGHIVESDVPENAVFTDTIYDDSAIKGRLSDIENTYLPKTEIESSIETAKQEAITAILGGTVEEDFDTLKEVSEWILSDTTNSAELINRITAIENNYLRGTDKSELQQMIAELQSFVGTLPSTSTSTTVVQYIQEVVNALNINKVDKIEGKSLSTNDYDDTEKTTVAQNKSDIANLKEEIAHMDIQTTTSPTLYGSKNGGVRLNHMVARTEQKQYKGTNLFGGLAFANAVISAVTSNSAGINSSDRTLWLSSSSYTDNKCIYSDFKENTQYTFFVKGSNRNSDYSTVTNLKLLYTDGSYSNISFTQSGSTVFVSKKDSTIAGLYTIYFAGTSIIYYEDFGIFEGVLTLEDFEPYVGNAPSPNPEYQQSLNHTGDCVQMVQGYYNRSNGVYANETTGICSKYKIPCKAGDTIKIALESSCNINTLYYNNDTFAGVDSSSNAIEHNATVPSGVTHFAISITHGNGITPSTVGKISLTVNGKFVHQIVETGKNLFDCDEASISLVKSTNRIHKVYSNGSIRLDSGEYYMVVFDLVLKNSAYPLSFQLNGDNNGISLLTNGNVYYNKITIRGLTNINFLYFYMHMNDNDTATATFSKIMIVKADDVDLDTITYESFQSHIVTFYTEQPTREGDRIVNVDNLWQVERNVARHTLTGSDIIKKNDTDINNYLYWVGNFVNKIKKGSIVISDKLPNKPTNMIWEDNIGISCGVSNNVTTILYFNLGKYITDNTPEFITEYLNSNPIEFEYATNTPTYEALDTASQIALNSLKSFNGATHIEIDSRVQPSEISLDYGTSRVGAMAIKGANDNLIDYVEREQLKSQINELTVALALLSETVNGGATTSSGDVGEEIGTK